LEIRVQKKFAVVLLPSLIFSAYYLLIGKIFEAILVLSIALAIVGLLVYVGRKKTPTRIDYHLVTFIFHMYALSLGETSPVDMVRTIAENKEYGFYSKVFQRIRRLAEDFGYGFTKATAQIAETVKPPLKDILVRCTSVFSSVEPRGYLEIEVSTLMEEYSGYYARAIDTLKTIGGIFTAFQSVTVFLIMTLAIMTIFMFDQNSIIFGYLIAGLALILIYILFRTTSPKEPVIYIGRFPPKFYLAFKWTVIAFVPSSAVIAFFLYFSRGAPLAFIVLGVGVIIPGIFGYRLEKFVSKVDRNYPTFLKALGESLTSTSDIKSAFSYILYMELGPLKRLVREALARLKLGLSVTKTLETLSSEAASYQAHISNRIFLDSLKRGANALKIGSALGNMVVRFLEFRKRKEIVAKNFQTIMFVMQPMTVALLVILRVLADFLSTTLVDLPYFGFSTIPITIVEIGNILLVLTMALVNALAVKEVTAGFWGSFFLNLGLLLIISGVTWMAAQFLVEMVFKSLPSIELPTM